MLYSTFVVAASALVGLASAQNTTLNTPIPCCTVSPNLVNATERSLWCEANSNTCVDICGGQGQIASNGNNCEPTTLKYTCKCQNGTDAQTAIGAYQQSVPAQMCRFWYGKCVEASGSDAQQRFQCKQALDSQCGNLTINDKGAVATASQSGSAAASASRTPTGSSSGASPSPSTGAAAAVAFAQYGTPILAGGLMAIFGIAL
ncbi:hypothetical protein DE146DRAFT_651987 [Phaeosphaeria sp. MPI-PUGE-AT-0046c]|nr:hypothetical protein DE146DRAFT_651987 [Phaeosphaeria sp. MPI-PUGE-AT-0046c]